MGFNFGQHATTPGDRKSGSLRTMAVSSSGDLLGELRAGTRSQDFAAFEIAGMITGLRRAPGPGRGRGRGERGLAACGSGEGPAWPSTRWPGSAALVNDCFSAHQELENDNMEHHVPGGAARVTPGRGPGARLLAARSREGGPVCRRLDKVAKLGRTGSNDRDKVFLAAPL